MVYHKCLVSISSFLLELWQSIWTFPQSMNFNLKLSVLVGQLRCSWVKWTKMTWLKQTNKKNNWGKSHSGVCDKIFCILILASVQEADINTMLPQNNMTYPLRNRVTWKQCWWAQRWSKGPGGTVSRKCYYHFMAPTATFDHSSLRSLSLVNTEMI